MQGTGDELPGSHRDPERARLVAPKGGHDPTSHAAAKLGTDRLLLAAAFVAPLLLVLAAAAALLLGGLGPCDRSGLLIPFKRTCVVMPQTAFAVRGPRVGCLLPAACCLLPATSHAAAAAARPLYSLRCVASQLHATASAPGPSAWDLPSQAAFDSLQVGSGLLHIHGSMQSVLACVPQEGNGGGGWWQGMQTGASASPTDTPHPGFSPAPPLPFESPQSDPSLLPQQPALLSHFEAAPWLLPPATPALPHAGVHDLAALLALRAAPGSGINRTAVAMLPFNKLYAVITQNCSE